MNLKGLFKIHWQQVFAPIISTDYTIIVAASGGADSTVLIHLLYELNIPIVLAHVNFQLRGAESDHDEAFVQSLADRLQLKAVIKKIDTQYYASHHKLSIQEAARVIRYDWFQELINDNGVSNAASSNCFIATAHHTDDNIETVMMHFFRGTGIDGLKGIPMFYADKKILRPLLPFSRETIEAYALEQGIDYVTDSSNLKSDYTRNYFRNELIPQLQQVFPQVKENITHNIHRFKEVADLYHQAVAIQIKKLVEPKANEWHIPVLKWKKTIPLHTISWEIIKTFGFSAGQAIEMVKLLDSANGSSMVSSTHRIIKNRLWMIIAPLQSTAAAHILIESTGSTVFEDGVLELIPTASAEPSSAFFCEYIEFSKIQFPLILRKWKAGDYFYPLGMTKKKKVSKFLIDAKLSKIDKEKVWVLEMDKKIIALLGYRIDNRFRYTSPHQPMLEISYRR
jgi:tRNA(Ile)-lysidine synthase